MMPFFQSLGFSVTLSPKAFFTQLRFLQKPFLLNYVFFQSLSFSIAFSSKALAFHALFQNPLPQGVVLFQTFVFRWHFQKPLLATFKNFFQNT